MAEERFRRRQIVVEQMHIPAQGEAGIRVPEEHLDLHRKNEKSA
jgi:hypothetical protein